MQTKEQQTENLHAALIDLLREIAERTARLEAFRLIIYKATNPTGAIVHGHSEDAAGMLTKARETLSEAHELEGVESLSVSDIAAAIRKAIGE